MSYSRFCQGIELSSDACFYDILAKEPLHILKGNYMEYLPLAGWPPLIGYYLILSKFFSDSFLSYRILFFGTLLLGIFFFEVCYINQKEQKKVLSLLVLTLPISFFCLVLFPQEDVLFSILVLFISYFYEKKENFLAVGLLLLLGFMFVKIFTVLLNFLLVLHFFVKKRKLCLEFIVPIFCFVLYLVFHLLNYRTFIFDIGDKSPNFYNNSPSLASLIWHINTYDTHIFFSFLFVIFNFFFIFYVFKSPNLRFTELLLMYFTIYYLSYFYYSPEYLIWILFPVMILFLENNNKSILKYYPLLCILVFLFNISRGFYLLSPLAASKLTTLLNTDFSFFQVFFYKIMIISIIATNLCLAFFLKKLYKLF